MHVALEVAPTIVLNVPAGQGVALKEPKGQKDPAGHTTGTPLAQKKPALHGMHCSRRMRLLS